MGRMYTVKDLAAKFNVNPQTVWKWAREGRITVIKVGRLIRIPEASVYEFETRNTERSHDALDRYME